MPFDVEIDREVARAERALRRGGFAPFSSRLSDLRRQAHDSPTLGALLDLLQDETCATKRRKLIRAADELQLNGTPSFLRDALAARLSAVARTRTEHDALLELHHRALRTEWKNVDLDILGTVFGGSLSPTLQMGRRLSTGQSRRAQSRKRLPETAVDSVLAAFLADHPRLRPLIPRFAVRITRSKGFGAYWPRELLTSDSDLLELSLNEDALVESTLLETLAHEVAGHALHYELLRRVVPPFFDHGALALIEGWATSAEWLVTRSRPTRARLALLDLLGKDEEYLATELPRLAKAQGYSPGLTTSITLNWSQLPGYQASYLLGGLWFLDRIRDLHEGVLLLADIANRPTGDFLGLY